MPVEYVCADSIGHVRLRRPKVANAFDLEAAEAFGKGVREFAADDSAKVGLITGEGARFCAGGDASAMARASDPAAYVERLATSLDSALQELAAVDKPVIAAVRGAVAGAGFGLMLSCDVVLAAAGTKFALAYAGVGLTPDCGVSWLLPRAIGQQRALELALTGRVLDADEARDWGLVAGVVPDVVEERAHALAATMAAGPAHALGQARRLLRASWTTSRQQAGAAESRTIADAVVTPQASALLSRFRS